jgi:CheY-like chemotaxis protein
MDGANKILFVEDDVLIARIYRPRLEEAGFQVAVAEDGLAAMKLLMDCRPHLVVLDLLMPKMTGVDVIKFIRGHPDLKSTPVVVFSNGFLQKIWLEASGLGVQQMVSKSSATPAQLIEILKSLLKQGSAGAGKASAPAASPQAAVPAGACSPESAAGFRDHIRRDFFQQIPTISKNLQRASHGFVTAPRGPENLLRLEELRRRSGFLTHMTGMAGCYRIAQLSSALEALLFELQFNPASSTNSVLHTISSTVDLLVASLGRALEPDEQCLSPTHVLLVDDDAVSKHMLMLSLGRANLKTDAVGDALPALEKLRNYSYDVAILDINLPGMTGIALCEEMRKLPAHEKTPVIFITSYAEFEPLARSILKGGDELIGKPIMPVELTVKVIAQLLKRRLQMTPAAS